MNQNDVETVKKKVNSQWLSYMEAVGNNIKQAREAISMSQEKLARKTCISRTHITMLESGKTMKAKDKPSNITLQNLVLISKALDVEISSLLPNQDEAPTLSDIQYIYFA